MPLTDTACRNAKPSERRLKIADGGGLYLLVEPTGSKLWRQAYRFGGKQKLLAHGSYPAVKLADARAARDAAKELLAKGIDPAEEKRARKSRRKLNQASSFESIAREWFEMRADGWTVAYSSRTLRRLETDIFPKLGILALDQIEPPALLGVIRAIEARGAVVLARRLLQICGQIFRFAVASGRAVRDPSQDIRGALRTPSTQRHRASLRAAELGPFLKALAGYSGNQQTALAFRFVIHTMVRTGEARFASWSEIEQLDGPKPLWRIPAERMKMRSPHLVPLTTQAVAILRNLKELAGNSPYVFPSPTKAGVISENTLIYALYRLGYHSRATVHGFRGSASTVLNEQGFNRDWIERQLAHSDRDEVRAAYNAAEWLVDRRVMLQWWSDYLVASEDIAKSEVR